MNAFKITIALIIICTIAFGCTTPGEKKPASPTEIANPASVNCKEKGGVLDIRNGEEGQFGVCTLPDGTTCEEWAFMRGECPKKCDACPEYVMPGPEFCKNGVIVATAPDNCGCAGPPKCILN